jgi:hypothetical protein
VGAALEAIAPRPALIRCTVGDDEGRHHLLLRPLIALSKSRSQSQ